MRACLKEREKQIVQRRAELRAHKELAETPWERQTHKLLYEQAAHELAFVRALIKIMELEE